MFAPNISSVRLACVKYLDSQMGRNRVPIGGRRGQFMRISWPISGLTLVADGRQTWTAVCIKTTKVIQVSRRPVPDISPEGLLRRRAFVLGNFRQRQVAVLGVDDLVDGVWLGLGFFEHRLPFDFGRAKAVDFLV